VDRGHEATDRDAALPFGGRHDHGDRYVDGGDVVPIPLRVSYMARGWRRRKNGDSTRNKSGTPRLVTDRWLIIAGAGTGQDAQPGHCPASRT